MSAPRSLAERNWFAAVQAVAQSAPGTREHELWTVHERSSFLALMREREENELAGAHVARLRKAS